MNSLQAAAPIANPTPSNPRESWPAWTDQRWTITDADLVDTTDHAVELEPTPEEQAWWSGFDLGYLGETAVPPSDLAESLRLSWWRGYGNGETRRDREEILGAEDEAWLATLDFEPGQYPEPDFYELAEAGGSDFARAYRG